MPGGSREQNITAAVRAGLLPSNFSTDDSNAGVWYSGNQVKTRQAGAVNNAQAADGITYNIQYPQVDLSPLTKSLQDYIDQSKQIASENSARSAEYAREQRDWSSNQAAIAREFNASEAAKNRSWQQMMSNTAHQREVADLKAAGLNPILSAMNGNGAAVTSGASASASVPSGDKGEVDTSVNSSIVGLLSSMLSAQTQLQAANISARTQEAVAEKYTAMQQLVSEMSNATSRANAQLAAETSRYGVDVSSWTTLSANEKSVAAQRYGAELQAAASRYGVELSTANAYKIAMAQLDWQSQHPSNMWQGLGEALAGFGTSISGVTSGVSKAMSDLQSTLKGLIPRDLFGAFGSSGKVGSFGGKR